LMTQFCKSMVTSLARLLPAVNFLHNRALGKKEPSSRRTCT
jgi:hypothetical protein